MERDLTTDLVRVTEAAALAAARQVGGGDPEAADAAAVRAMRAVLATVDFDGLVTIGEGEMDEAPMLFIGERVGSGRGETVDVAVDPIDGTEAVVKGLPGAISALAVAPRGSLLHAPDMYMKKLAVGPRATGKVDLDANPEEIVRAVADALGKRPTNVTVAILDRPRHASLIEAVRRTGARVLRVAVGDVAVAIAAGIEASGIDLLLGSGGAPEGVLAAAALRCLGGDFQGQLLPVDDRQEERASRMLGGQPRRLLRLGDLAGTGDVAFAATAITPGHALQGVSFVDGQARTQSLATQASTARIRFVRTIHRTLSDARG